jgi:hypothetical protein
MLIRYSAMRYLLLPAGAFFLATVGCSGGNSGMSTSSMSTSPPPMTLMADFDSIQANIFTPLCAGCHSGPNPAANLSLDAAHSYNDLVNIPSTEQPTLVRVKPGDPTNSYLAIHLQKEGDGAPASDIPFVVQWIMDGAQPGNSSMSMAAEFRVAAVEPNTGDTLQAPPPRIIIGFTRELDASGANTASVHLERIDENADARPRTVSTIPANVLIPADNARALTLTPTSALPPGQYQVVLDTASGAAIRALGGESLAAPAPEVTDIRVVTRFSVAAEREGTER